MKKEQLEKAKQKLEISKAYIRGREAGIAEVMEQVKEVFSNNPQQDTSFNPTANIKC
jgi:hypothetical protein